MEGRSSQVERTYTGPQTGSEDVVEHMKSCNPRGPLIIQVAKLFPKSDVSSFGEALSMEKLPAFWPCTMRTHHLLRAGCPRCGIEAVFFPICARPRDAHVLADAFGRILSGTVKPGDKVRVLGEAYTPEDEEDSAVAEVSNVWVYQARYRIPLTKALAGEPDPSVPA